MAMRIGARLVVGIGLLLAAACNAPSPDEPACFSAKGVCLLSKDVAECVGPPVVTGVCPATYICCIPKGAYDYDAGVDAPPPVPDAAKDAAKDVSADIAKDTGSDAAKTVADASKLDTGTKD
jgi:hypothetical protein